MDTSQIKRFAVEARNILKQGVINRIAALGFNDKGEVAERNKPQRLQGNTLFMGQLYDENFYDKWFALNNRVQTKGIKEVYEEAAYTWFNRLMAIRIMEKNGFTEPVLAFDNDRLRIPRIVSNARAGQFYVEETSDREKLSELLMDDTKTTEQFTLLITSFCHTNPVINNCFGGVSGYTEILLPTNILSEGGFVDMLNHTGFITDDDFKKSELIGWLYQFYISEKKDEVFASFKNKHKAQAEDIPAATQIFTPNWIVKYMVQNTVGRIYLDNNPNSDLKENWKYLIEPSSSTPRDSIFKYDDPKELTMADLGCGSGHILNEGFDILYDIYIEEGYSRKQAIENIFKYNLTGVDIDTRAKQLATFALIMKACQKDDSFLDCHIMPNVLDMPEPINNLNKFFGCFMHDLLHSNTMVNAIKLCQQADNLGSIMKFDITEKDREDLQFCIDRWYEEHETHEFNNDPNDVRTAKLILALTNKYAAIVMNPPYMGSGNMNSELSSYVREKYTEGKEDICTVFMILSERLIFNNGLYGMINMQSWMFNSRLEAIRNRVLNELSIVNMLHLGAQTFDELSGEVVQNTSFVIRKKTPSNNTCATYYRLVNGNNCFEKEQLFLSSHNQHNICFQNIPQANLTHIPGNPICYWAGKQMIELFKNDTLGEYGWGSKGIITGDNARFLRLWYEVGKQLIKFDAEKYSDCYDNGKKWYPCTKGGGFRKWFGNNEYVIDWENNGFRVIRCAKEEKRNCQDYQDNYKFLPSFSWADVCSNKPSFRYTINSLSESKGMCLFSTGGDIYEMGGFLNSAVANFLLLVLSPTLMVTSGAISKLPFLGGNQEIIKYVQSNISISKQDWDAHETSWDFQTNELIALNEDTYVDTMYAMYEGADVQLSIAAPQAEKLQWRLKLYKEKWEDKFNRLLTYEEELNRQFIEIYGLQDELTPEVPMEEVTILQQGEISIKDDEIVWNDDVIIKQLISYSIGCMMGRYRLDKPGLHIAHPNPKSDEICTYTYKGSDYTIDDDGIMPLLSRDCGFDDNGVLRFTEFLRVAFGEKELTENLNYVEKCLGKTIEDYLKKDFWKDHKKMYQNRPIYWLFSSKKGAFQVIAYMHRMNPYTVEQIRTKYLLPHIEYLNNRIYDMELKESTLSTSERKALSKLKVDLAECQEYHERLHLVADQQIGFDLDDGVVVNYAKFGDVVAKIK